MESISHQLGSRNDIFDNINYYQLRSRIVIVYNKQSA